MTQGETDRQKSETDRETVNSSILLLYPVSKTSKVGPLIKKKSKIYKKYREREKGKKDKREEKKETDKDRQRQREKANIEVGRDVGRDIDREGDRKRTNTQ